MAAMTSPVATLHPGTPGTDGLTRGVPGRKLAGLCLGEAEGWFEALVALLWSVNQERQGASFSGQGMAGEVQAGEPGGDGGRPVEFPRRCDWSELGGEGWPGDPAAAAATPGPPPVPDMPGAPASGPVEAAVEVVAVEPAAGTQAGEPARPAPAGESTWPAHESTGAAAAGESLPPPPESIRPAPGSTGPAPAGESTWPVPGSTGPAPARESLPPPPESIRPAPGSTRPSPALLGAAETAAPGPEAGEAATTAEPGRQPAWSGAATDRPDPLAQKSSPVAAGPAEPPSASPSSPVGPPGAPEPPAPDPGPVVRAEEAWKTLNARVTGLDQNRRTIEVALEPEGLGPMRLEVKLARDGSPEAVFEVTNQRLEHLLTSREAELRQTLESWGLQLGAVDVRLGSGGGREQNPAADPSPGPENSGTAPAPARRVPVETTRRGLIDYRV